jgi:hypothetical protein
LTGSPRDCLNARVSFLAEFKFAFEEIIVPELRAIRAELQGIRDEMWRIHAELRPLRRAMLGELRRLSLRLDVVDQELRRPTSCVRSTRRCRGRGPRD